MNIPTSTYRLQFRGGVTFERAVKLVPYLEDIGISHVYASPIFTATTGSTHGYDVTDPNEVDPALGGRQGLDVFVAALQRAGMGLILDIVPNHMAASIENVWWRDVLAHGRHSAFAGYFDIDWSRKLTLPRLGKPVDEALAAGEFKLRYDAANGRMMLFHFDDPLPLSDESAKEVLAEAGFDAARLQAFSADPVRMKELLGKQHWQLLCWKDAAANLSYRRFFEVAELVGLRVEDPSVFEATHRLAIDLVRSGQVQGLRIDHIDGLADPKAYLDRLRQAVGFETFLVVEKILGPHEALPSDWPVSGTTGYEFITAMADLFVEEEGLGKIDAAYRMVGDDHVNFASALRAAKLQMVERNFAGEMARLAELAHRLLPQFGEEALSTALRELLTAFPVYRTYGYQGALSAEDDAVLRDAIERARLSSASPAALNALGELLRGEIADSEAMEFRARLQQLSGPVMAKSVEDTLFYRYNRLLGMNEVGGEPARSPGGVAAVHRFMLDRCRRQPCGLSATSTHDTKRGEDARARLYALTQRPKLWIDGVERWRRMNARFRSDLADGPAPEPNIEWMLYQALLGIWPAPMRQRDREDLRERLSAYAQKAIREAKLRTDWMDSDEVYEAAVLDFVRELLSETNNEFLTDFGSTVAPFVELGHRNSLSQLLIKLTAPGIPDIYQGAETLDFSMVDPDNRRPVSHIWAGAPRSEPASLKRQITRSVLRYRRDNPDLFLNGTYLPLEVAGPKKDSLIVFARFFREQVAITVASRLADPDRPVSEFWEDTTIVMPPEIDCRMRDLLTGNLWPSGDLAVAGLLAVHPVAFLVKPD